MTEALTTAITTGCTKVVDSATAGVTAVLPLGLEVMALYTGIRLTIGFFRSIAN